MRFPEPYPSYLKELLPVHEARLELGLVNVDGRTKIERRLTKNQLSVSRPLPMSPGLESFYLINTSGGIVQGDRLDVRITLGKGCRAHVATQSANKIYGMEANCAVQRTAIELKEGAYLEYVPEPNIPYAGSRFFQSNIVKLHKSSKLFYWDIAYPGRYSRKEEFGCDAYFSRLGIYFGKEPALIDTVLIDPERQNPRSAGIMGGKKFFANVYAYAEDYGQFEKCLKSHSYCVNAAGIMLVRMLGNDPLALRKKLEKIYDAFRRAYNS
jgi:urease accessory protein